MKAGTYNLKLFGTYADTDGSAEFAFSIIIKDPCTTPVPTIASPTLPSTQLEYFIDTDDDLVATLATDPYGVTPVFCPTAFTVTVSPTLSTSYWSFNESM